MQTVRTGVRDARELGQAQHTTARAVADRHVTPGRWVLADLMQEGAGELLQAPDHT
jgi:hypothetical protein